MAAKKAKKRRKVPNSALDLGYHELSEEMKADMLKRTGREVDGYFLERADHIEPDGERTRTVGMRFVKWKGGADGAASS